MYGGLGDLQLQLWDNLRKLQLIDHMRTYNLHLTICFNFTACLNTLQ